jgi:AcrR family transcriptional regulator
MVAKKHREETRCVRGRPRDPELEARILEVTLQHLAGSGYSRMSLDRIAEESGASKPTLYRRWASKADLATAALRTIQINEPTLDSGSTPGDLTGVLQNFRRSLLRPNGMSLIGTVLAEEAHTPELLALFRERLVSARRQMLRAILEKANGRGELRDGVRLDTVASLLIGAFYAHYLADPKVPAAFPAELVDIVWRGIKA